MVGNYGDTSKGGKFGGYLHGYHNLEAFRQGGIIMIIIILVLLR
jgi:hypothetical protein